MSRLQVDAKLPFVHFVRRMPFFICFSRLDRPLRYVNIATYSQRVTFPLFSHPRQPRCHDSLSTFRKASQSLSQITTFFFRLAITSAKGRTRIIRETSRSFSSCLAESFNP